MFQIKAEFHFKEVNLKNLLLLWPTINNHIETKVEKLLIICLLLLWKMHPDKAANPSSNEQNSVAYPAKLFIKQLQSKH